LTLASLPASPLAFVQSQRGFDDKSVSPAARLLLVRRWNGSLRRQCQLCLAEHFRRRREFFVVSAGDGGGMKLIQMEAR